MLLPSNLDRTVDLNNLEGGKNSNQNEGNGFLFAIFR